MPKYALIPLLLYLVAFNLPAQTQTDRMRKLEQLINTEEPGWDLVMEWKAKATNKIEILPRDSLRADSALHALQVTTRSPMGAITYETGGIMIDDGWIRILGSGSERLSRSIMSWNKGKSFEKQGEQPSFVLIADDAVGGFFAINGGGISKDDMGSVFYFAAESMEWQSLELGYSDFVNFCFSGKLNMFYEGLRWKKWRKDVKELHGDQAFTFYPYLSTVEGRNINKVSRDAVPIEELWIFNFSKK